MGRALREAPGEARKCLHPPWPGNQIVSGFSALPRALQEPSPHTPRLRSPHDRAAGVCEKGMQPQNLETQRGPGGGGWGEASPSSLSRIALDLNMKAPPPPLPGSWPSPSTTERAAGWCPQYLPPPPTESGRPNTPSLPCGPGDQGHF